MFSITSGQIECYLKIIISFYEEKSVLYLDKKFYSFSIFPRKYVFAVKKK